MATKIDSAIGSYCGQYKVIRYISSGNYGALYLGKHNTTGKEVAIKCESKDESNPQLPLEYRFYGLLKGVSRVPNILYFGSCSPNYHGLVMDLLGPSIENIFELCGREFSIKTTALLAIQFIEIFESIHKRKIIHRDIKPENFLLGLNKAPKANTLHLVDFGMAKEFIDEKTKKHIPFRTDKGFLGTARYASTNAHFNKELSRRDDLEAVGHILVYVFKGELPWQGLICDNETERIKQIGELKRNLSVSELCSEMPEEFRNYMQYVQGLDFKENPNYNKMRNFFKIIAGDRFSENIFDWNQKQIHNK